MQVPGLASKVQLTACTAAPGLGPGLRKVFGCWNCRAKMRPKQRAALRAFASARQWCVHGLIRTLAMTSTMRSDLRGDSACSLKAYVQRVRLPSACAVAWGWKPSFLCATALGRGAELTNECAAALFEGSLFSPPAPLPLCPRQGKVENKVCHRRVYRVSGVVGPIFHAGIQRCGECGHY